MDIDAGVNGLVEYFLVEGTHNQTAATATSKDGRKIALADGFGIFEIAYPHQGHVSLNDDRRFDLNISLLSLFFHPVRFLGHHCQDTGLRASSTLLPHHCCIGELLSTLILLSVRVYVRETQGKKECMIRLRWHTRRVNKLFSCAKWERAATETMELTSNRKIAYRRCQ